MARFPTRLPHLLSRGCSSHRRSPAYTIEQSFARADNTQWTLPLGIATRPAHYLSRGCVPPRMIREHSPTTRATDWASHMPAASSHPYCNLCTATAYTKLILVSPIHLSYTPRIISKPYYVLPRRCMRGSTCPRTDSQWNYTPPLILHTTNKLCTPTSLSSTYYAHTEQG